MKGTGKRDGQNKRELKVKKWVKDESITKKKRGKEEGRE